jgi:L-lactate dehydrogenase (cytochrome)
VLRVLALGAKSCLIGRPYIFGLGAGGEAGVAKAIDIIRSELNISMALTGVNRIDEIGRHNLML